MRPLLILAALALGTGCAAGATPGAAVPTTTTTNPATFTTFPPPTTSTSTTTTTTRKAYVDPCPGAVTPADCFPASTDTRDWAAEDLERRVTRIERAQRAQEFEDFSSSR